jgi:hypothetical protein
MQPRNLARPHHFSHAVPAMVESMERRLCLSVSVSQDGATLLIQGDGADDRISIVDHGGGDVTVEANGGGVRDFAGVDLVRARSGGGGDSVDYLIGNPEIRPADFSDRPWRGQRPFHVRCPRGVGANRSRPADRSST